MRRAREEEDRYLVSNAASRHAVRGLLEVDAARGQVSGQRYNRVGGRQSRRRAVVTEPRLCASGGVVEGMRGPLAGWAGYACDGV